MRSYLHRVIHTTLLWTTRWAGLSAVIGIALMLARVPSPADSGPQPNEVSEYSFWILLSALTIPAGFVVSFVAASIIFLAEHRRDTPKTIARTGSMAWSVITLFGSFVLLLYGAGVALISIVFSGDAPHAWKGDWRIGLVGLLIAFILVFVGIISARDSTRHLRSLLEMRMSGRATRSEKRL